MMDSRRILARREFFYRAGSGLAQIALAGMLAQENAAVAAAIADPLAPRKPHHPPKAQNVIWLFMEGGPSHVDLFDPKPKLKELDGQPIPASFWRPRVTAGGTGNNTLMASRRAFQQHGQSGLWVSDWYPHVAQHVDDLVVIRSCHADALNHVGSVSQMNSGAILHGRPSLGAWVTYGLGSSNRNLP